MSQKVSAVLALVVVAASAAAQVRGPNDVTVAVGRLASVPLTIDGDESDYQVLGSDVDAFREFTPDPKQLRLRVIGYAPGTAYVVVASVKGGKLQPLYKVTVTVTGPTPPPPPPVPPVPPPDPPTPDSPPPIAGDGFKVLVVFEEKEASTLTTGQQTALYGAETRKWLDANATAYRFYDKDQDVSAAPPEFRDAMKRPRVLVPWLLISTGKSGYEGPLPATRIGIDGLLKEWHAKYKAGK